MIKLFLQGLKSSLTVLIVASLCAPAYAGFKNRGGGGGGFGGGSRGGGFGGFGKSSGSRIGGFGKIGGGAFSVGSTSRSSRSRSRSRSSALNSILSGSNSTSSTRNRTRSSSTTSRTTYNSGWSSSLLNGSNNPVVGRVLGTPTEDIGTQQGFGALITAKSPLALFLDLNGNGVRGDMIDGLLFNIFFGNYFDGDSYSVTGDQAPRSQIKPEARRYGLTEKIRNGLKTTRIPLVDPLSDGTSVASLESLMAKINITDPGQASSGDAAIALATVLQIMVLHPPLASLGGPVVDLLPSGEKSDRSKMLIETLSKDLVKKDASYRSGGSRLAFQVSMSRLGAVMGLTEMALEHDIPLRDEALEALRGALYFAAFEVKRLKVDDGEREEIMKSMVAKLIEKTPNAARLAAEKASSEEALVKLEEVMLKVAPVINQKRMGDSKWKRFGASALASGAALGSWLLFGDSLVDSATANIALEMVIDDVSLGLVPGAAGALSYWMLGPPKQLKTEEVIPSYQGLCEQLMKAN